MQVHLIPFTPSHLLSIIILSFGSFVNSATGLCQHPPSSFHQYPPKILLSPTFLQMSTDSTFSLRAGFLGCGTIGSSIASALANPAHAAQLAQNSLSLASLSVTRRSEYHSSRLKQLYPHLVTVYDSAAEVVESSDIVFLCVLPEQQESLLEELRERNVWREERHTLVSLVSTSHLEDLIHKTNLPNNRVYKMICLPSIAQREGCSLLYPPASKDTNRHPYLTSLLRSLGGCVECATEDLMNVMMIPTCLMGPMYGILKNNRDWLVSHGASPEDASYFVSRTYRSIVTDAERGGRDPMRFEELIQEQTPGGLNEQSLRNLEHQGVFEAYNKAMDAILSRLQGSSDGSLSTFSEDDG